MNKVRKPIIKEPNIASEVGDWVKDFFIYFGKIILGFIALVVIFIIIVNTSAAVRAHELTSSLTQCPQMDLILACDTHDCIDKIMYAVACHERELIPIRANVATANEIIYTVDAIIAVIRKHAETARANVNINSPDYYRVR